MAAADAVTGGHSTINPPLSERQHETSGCGVYTIYVSYLAFYDCIAMACVRA